MNVYDFDKTIYYPDSSYCFVLFSLRRHPGAVLKHVPSMALMAVRKLFGSADTRMLKEKVFAFLSDIEDIEGEVELFWKENRHRIGQWYLEQKRPDDLIISASPEFLLKPIAADLGFSLMATRMDKRSGMIEGANCHDREKLRRFREEYPDGVIDEFYSDSHSDAPLAEEARSAYIVKRHTVSKWK